MADVPLRPLVAAEEAWLAAELSDGRRPAVHLLAVSGELGAGSRARLVAADPGAQGEYLIVEVRGDRLPFAASELALPPTVAKRVRRSAGVIDVANPSRRTTKTSRRGAPQAGLRRTPATALTATAPTATAPTATAPTAPAPATATVPAKAVPAKAVPAKAVPAKAVPANAVPAKAVPAKAVPAKAVPPTRRRPMPIPISVTISFDGTARWTAEARAGSRRVRPVEISAGAAAAASAALGVPDVDVLVSAITDSMRREAEDRTANLRAQLAAAEAELARLSPS